MPDNLRSGGGVGLEWSLHDWDSRAVVTGVNLAAFQFQRNLRYFSLGHGGYFSPQGFVHAGVPLLLRGEIPRLRWEVRGEAGLNAFRENPADAYPGQPGLRPSPQPGGTLPLSWQYPSSESLAFALDGRARLAWRVTDPIELAVDLQVHTANDYRETTAGLLLRYQFRARNPVAAAPRWREPGEP